MVLATRRMVLADSSAYFALADPDEADHTRAVTIVRRLVAERWRVFTTNFIVAEAHALHLNRLGRRVALEFLRRVDHGATTIVRVTEQDERRGREIIERYDDKRFSLTDATSFAVMERLGLRQAFAFDRDFAQYGFSLLEA